LATAWADGLAARRSGGPRGKSVSKESTQSLHDADLCSGIVGSMTLHVMLTGHGRAPTPIGLCGAKVAGLYFSKVPGDGKRESHLCPACKALAAKKVAPKRLV
jgi:hypothetical protein